MVTAAQKKTNGKIEMSVDFRLRHEFSNSHTDARRIGHDAETENGRSLGIGQQRVVLGQAMMFATNQVFVASSMVFVIAAVTIWIAPRPTRITGAEPRVLRFVNDSGARNGISFKWVRTAAAR
jgi:hypothetical protein